MKAGCIGPCPQLEGTRLPAMLVLPENSFAVLLDETKYESFRAKMDETADIETVYIVTDSELNYRDMARGLKCSNMYQLYRDYMDNFRINVRG